MSPNCCYLKHPGSDLQGLHQHAEGPSADKTRCGIRHYGTGIALCYPLDMRPPHQALSFARFVFELRTWRTAQLTTLHTSTVVLLHVGLQERLCHRRAYHRVLAVLSGSRTQREIPHQDLAGRAQGLQAPWSAHNRSGASQGAGLGAPCGDYHPVP